ncbi:MAG TPA: hypothetical protein VKT70_07485, partial [Stellaceae bacterium]|nr:hypothetical protein [Stellaceae bacterium]
MRYVTLVALMILGSASSSLAEEAGPTLSLINPGIELDGAKVKSLSATLDDGDFGECEAERRQLFNSCVKPRKIHSGPHILEVELDLIDAKPKLVTVKFTAGLGGKFVFDAKGLTKKDARESDYFSETPPSLPHDASCLAALDGVTRISSCTEEGVKALDAALGRAVGACRAHAGKQEATERLLTEIGEDLFSLPINQCYNADNRKALPYYLTEGVDHEGVDHEGGAHDDSDWKWSRDVIPDLSPETPLATALEKFRQTLPELRKRVAVVEGVANAYLKDDNPPPILKAAQQGAWSLDPATPDGRRMVLLLHAPHLFSDHTFSDFVAAKVMSDETLDCASRPIDAALIVDYFTFRDGTYTEEDALTPAGWQAILAMAGRIPADGKLDACIGGFDNLGHTRSPVSPSEQLHRFFAFDCAEGRTPEVRGWWLEKTIQNKGYFYRVPEPLREELKTDFASCLADRTALTLAALTQGILEKAEAKGCKIGPAAKCASIDLSGADLRGRDLHD